MEPSFSYQYERMLDRHTPNGLSAAVLQDLRPRLAKAKKQLITEWKTGGQGWLSCPDDSDTLKQVRLCAKKFAGYTTCLVIGIGGSDLGARAAYQALGASSKGMALRFLGNPDPDEVAEVLSHIEWKKTVVNIISKSGDTLEPMAIFAIVWDKMCRALGKAQAACHVVATTDAEQGSLRAFANREGLQTLAIPRNIGGRFSVLTSVGLFPLACAGIDIVGILEGAKKQRDQFERSPWGGEAATFAALHVMGMVLRNQQVHVLMPYASRLEGCAKWFRQLWAESLGKEQVEDGKRAHVGATPVASLGAIDQHSQVQLYMEGPADKLITFIKVSSYSTKQKIPATIRQFPNLSVLSGMDLAHVLQAEAEATSQALSAAGRPNGTVYLSHLSPETIGSFFLFFEIATGMAGHMLHINPYDQPGVEAGKKATYAILGA